MNAEFQPNPAEAAPPPAASPTTPNAAAAGAQAHRRGRLDRALLIAVLAMQCLVLAGLGLFFFNNVNERRRQHEPLGNHPTATTPPNRGSLVLPSDPSSTPGPARSQTPAARPVVLQAPGGAPAISSHARPADPFARMQAEIDRHTRSLFPDLDPAASLPPFPGRGRPSDLDAQISRMMNNAMREFSAMHHSLNFDEDWNLRRSPTLDIQDAGREYVVVCSLPGLDDTEVQVTLEGRLLTISGQSSSTARHPLETVQFEKRVQFPGPVDQGDHAAAMLTNGVLRVVVPKGDGTTQVAKLTRLM